MPHESSRAQDVEELTRACLERLADEGESVVDRVCADRPDLLDEVRAVLRQLQAVGLVSKLTGTAEHTFGDFRLLREVGGGGMGVVWLAEQRSLNRRVALKMLRPGFSMHPRLQERFRREARALSKLDHPGICPVYEAGDVDGVPYIAMRFIEGQSLLEVLDDRRQERAASGARQRSTSRRHTLDLVQLVETVARSLHAAHVAGVVHRDLKPGNVLLESSGGPVLVDFGLARDDDPELHSLTATGEPVGTPAYMAPEQVSGRGQADARTDVFALGVLLYECLTLRTPFVGTGRHGLYDSILHDPVPNPCRFNSAVGRDLHAVLEKALDKDPKRRFGTALELADELGRIRRDEPVRTRNAGPLLRSARWCRRNRTVAVVLVAVSVALILSVVTLQLSAATSEQRRVLALMWAAELEAPRNPERALRFAREALNQGPPEDVDPLIVSRVQYLMSVSAPREPVREVEKGRLGWLGFSPDPMRRFLVICGPSCRPSLHRGADGRCLFEFPHEMAPPSCAVAFSPDARALAIGSGARVHVYALDDVWLQDQGVLACPAPSASFGPAPAPGEACVREIAWSRDGTRLALAYDGTASVWRRDGAVVELQGTLRQPGPQDGSARGLWRSVAFLPDGRLVAVGAIWSRDLHERRLLLDEDGAPVQAVTHVVTTESRILTLRHEDCGARLWDHEGRLIFTTHTSGRGEDRVTCADFVPGGDRFAVGFVGGRVELHGAREGGLINVFPGARGDTVLDLAFSPDGGLLACGKFGGTIDLWNVAGLLEGRLTGHQGQVRCVAFSPSADSLVSGSWDGTAARWGLGAPYPGVRWIRGRRLSSVARAGSRVVIATGRGEVLLCDARGDIQSRVEAPAGRCRVGVSPDGERIAIGPLGGRVSVWHPGSGAVTGWPGSPGTIFDCDFLADGRLLVLCGDDYRVHVGENGRFSVLPGFEDVLKMCVSDDGEKVLLGTKRGSWDLLVVRAGGLVRIAGDVVGQDDPVASAAFGAGDREVVVGTFSGVVSRWDVSAFEARRLGTPFHNGSHVFSLAVSPDGRRLASGSADGVVRIHDLAGGVEPMFLSFQDSSKVFSLVWLDGHVLVAGSKGARWLWADAEGLRVAVGKLRIGALSPEDKARYPQIFGF